MTPCDGLKRCKLSYSRSPITQSTGFWKKSLILNIWISISAQLETDKQNSDWLLLPKMVQRNVFFFVQLRTKWILDIAVGPQFWLWLRDYIHCTASNFATRRWKLATWLSKVFSTNLVPVALRCPILWLSISWLQVICDPNGTCWTPAYNFNYMSVVFCYCYCLYIYMIDRLQHRKLLPKGVIQHVPKARLRLRIFHRTFTAKAYALC